LQQAQGLVLTPAKPVTRIETALARYGEYLQQERGAAQATISCHRSSIRIFLEFIGFERSDAAMIKLKLAKIEAFVATQAKVCNRPSLRQVIYHLKGFLCYEYSQGGLPSPLHNLIETPRIYCLEQLPKALPWPQIQALLRSIDRNEPCGLRDYTILFLLAAYGLRRGEVAALTLDDIDWSARILHVRQSKTQQGLILPLTDEVGDVLQRYLRKGRPATEHRALFLRLKAPVDSIHGSAVYTILSRRIRASGLNLAPMGTHCFRHSFAVRLLHQGVSMKTIGDTLGHRAVDSTSIYLRLAIEDLRHVGLEVPQATAASPLRDPGWKRSIPLVRHRVDSPPTTGFRSGFGVSIQRYLAVKQATGRKYVNEAGILHHWDAFLFEQQGQARTVGQKLFQRWASSLGDLTPIRQRNCLRFVRNFLLFHARDHSPCFIPDSDTFPKPSAPRLPRLVSETETARLLATAAQLEPTPDNPLRAETYRIVLILLFCCGLRLGELMRLRLTHCDLKQNLLRIEETKFHKSRLIPLTNSVAKEVKSYVALNRSKQLLEAAESFLIWRRQRLEPQARYHGNGLRRIWQYLCVSAGVLDDRGRPPRIHDLRHGFAVAALERWYRQGENVQSKIPHLAAYLGHFNAASTYHYLHLTTKLREAASQRFHQRFASLFQPEGKI
jgi:site-specific recombinase XerD